MPEKILVIEDDPAIRAMIVEGLQDEGMEVIAVGTGVDGLVEESRCSPDLILLDLMLPDIDGFEVCRRLRTRSHVPVIVVTAKTDESDAVEALGVGADDFVRKPFQVREMVARIRALARRAGEYTEAARADELLNFGDLEVDTTRHDVTVRGETVRFTPKEFELLVMLARNAGKMMHREELLETIWGYDSTIDSRTLDVHIGRVRSKIEEDARAPKRIVTVPGVGYKFVGEREA
jgi:two-component system response regulator RegX3